ncbi:hypothetical protein [Zooshikella ganghwensis]|uniref:hypothetical protein n=1 Tax=Zooshikella ganghwensis TaxID=202772 RepID=UPI0013FE0613|nr:hypothetical protein [Zooshikella ganghwensis]
MNKCRYPVSRLRWLTTGLLSTLLLMTHVAHGQPEELLVKPTVKPLDLTRTRPVKN